jgi:predicted XRE-type DNA-binding protein
MNKKQNFDITNGSNNVFSDLGFIDAKERQIKTKLAITVNDLIKSHRLKQKEAALLLGVPQPKISALKNYQLDMFSVERLIEFLTALHQDVEIVIKPHNIEGEAGNISIFSVH